MLRMPARRIVHLSDAIEDLTIGITDAIAVRTPTLLQC
jgi:hypothetical protein